jgi:PAS domain S-box-containing protein
VRWEIHPWRNGRGEIGGIILFSEVITERKRAAELEREQRLLAEAMRDSLAVLTAALDVETVMQQILEFSARVVSSDAGGIVLMEGTQGRVAYLRGHTPEAEAFFKANPITVNEQVFQKGPDNQTYYLAADTNLTDGWTKFPATAWVRSSIGVQIELHGKPIGLLTADSATPNQYRQKDVENLQTFARYAALALESAHHVNHLEARVQERTAKLDAAKTQGEAILHNSPDGILLLHADLTIQQTNRAFHRLFHCEPEDCRGHSLLTLIDQADADVVAQLLRSATAEAQGKPIEIRATRNDGATFDAELSVGSIKGAGLVCIIRDITARKAQERQLRYHASLQENVSDAVIVTDAAFQIQSWNKAAERIYGWCAEEAIGRMIVDVLRTEFTAPDARAHNVQQLREQGWWQGEVVQHHRDGSLRYIWGSVTLLTDARGDVYRVVAINHDITERKEAEQALQQSAAEIHDLYNNAPCGYQSLDRDGVFTQINDTELRWLGYRREEVVGKLRFADIITSDSVRIFQTNFPLFKARGWIKDLEFDLVAKDGTTRRVLLSSTAIYGKDDQYLQSRSTLFDITELRQAQQGIVVSEARLRLLAENVHDLIVVYTGEGICTYVTPSAYALLGYSAEELVGYPLAALVHPTDRAYSATVGKAAIEAGAQSFMVQDRLLHKDGQYRWFEGTNTIVRDAQTQQFREGIAVFRDITARKAQERQLRYHASLQENVRDAVIVTDMHAVIQSWNKAAERIYGWCAAEVIGKAIVDVVHTQFSPPEERMRHSAQLREQGWWQGEVVEQHKDGTLRYILASVTLMRESDGEAYGVVAVNHDITERKQMEDVLQESETKYRLLVETMRGGLIMFDTEDKISYVNDRFCELVGRPRAQLLGTMPTSYVDDATAAQMKTQFDHRHRLENTSYELVVPRPDGQLRYLLAQGSPLLGKEGNFNGSFSIVTDITAQKQAEATLRQALAQEKELGELKSRFVSITSHEFRTPLATISATTETLLAYRDRLDSSQFDARLHKILTQVGHMRDMMDDVLQLARIQAHRVEFAPALDDLQALCCDIIEEFRSCPEYKERIHYENNCLPVQLNFDPRLMRHIIGNLIANGLKYSRNEKPITVKLWLDPVQVVLQVTDDGIGIPDADLNHIFEPFHRASNVGTISGTGLGLSITKEAIEMHGGRIHIATAVSAGTTVTVTLPINPAKGGDDAKDSDH